MYTQQAGQLTDQRPRPAGRSADEPASATIGFFWRHLPHGSSPMIDQRVWASKPSPLEWGPLWGSPLSVPLVLKCSVPSCPLRSVKLNLAVGNPLTKLPLNPDPARVTPLLWVAHGSEWHYCPSGVSHAQTTRRGL